MLIKNIDKLKQAFFIANFSKNTLFLTQFDIG